MLGVYCAWGSAGGGGVLQCGVMTLDHFVSDLVSAEGSTTVSVLSLSSFLTWLHHHGNLGLAHTCEHNLVMFRLSPFNLFGAGVSISTYRCSAEGTAPSVRTSLKEVV